MLINMTPASVSWTISQKRDGSTFLMSGLIVPDAVTTRLCLARACVTLVF